MATLDELADSAGGGVWVPDGARTGITTFKPAKGSGSPTLRIAVTNNNGIVVESNGVAVFLSGVDS